MNLYLHKITTMAAKRSVFYWIMFILSLGLAVGVYLFLPSMTSLTVVPVVTFLAKALDLI
jgi:hypothetical protein